MLPEFNAIRDRVLSENLLKPKIVYGWYPCERKNKNLVVDSDGKQYNFPLPRQKKEPNISLVDYFRNNEQGSDIVGFFVVTLGDAPGEICKELYDADKYHEYLLFHGFCVETAEALAQYTHNRMRSELGIETRGQRYSFGYSACPDLDLQEPLFSLLQAKDIGVELSSSMEMVPELSVSAIVLHHPQAHYFSV